MSSLLSDIFSWGSLEIQSISAMSSLLSDIFSVFEHDPVHGFTLGELNGEADDIALEVMEEMQLNVEGIRRVLRKAIKKAEDEQAASPSPSVPPSVTVFVTSSAVV